MTKKLTMLIVTLLAFASIFLVLEYNASQSGGMPGGPPGGTGGPPSGGASASVPGETRVAIPDVAVTRVVPAVHAAHIDAYGEASARFQLELTAEVSGRVIALSDTFESGRVIAEGEMLARIDRTDYLAALRSAEATFKSAELALLEEEREAEQAELDWKLSGLSGTPDSPLVLRAPQLASAKATLEDARAAIATASRDLKRTRLNTPFDALVVSRDVEPGSYVQTGTSIGTLYSTDRVEISIPLSEQQWRLLPDPATVVTHRWPATLVSADGERQWQAYVARIEQHENENRQRSLILAVDNPLSAEPALYPGSFVQASIRGQQFAGMWQLPSAALSQSNEIFLVTDDNTLTPLKVRPLFTDSRYIYVRPPEGMQQATVISRALMSYLPGMRVNPLEETTP